MIKAQVKGARLRFPNQTHHACGIMGSAKPGAKIGSSPFCVDDRFNLSRPKQTRHPE